jgi:tRNA 2-thiocytidine biosynthesis protein TtcA
MKAAGIAWTYFHDAPSFRLLDEQPEHGCDLCSRYRRRAVYEIARGLGANVIAFGHTADDFCEALLRNTLFTGRLSALPAVAHSRDKEFRLIRPLVYVSEEITSAYSEARGFTVIPCGCSQRTGTVRRSLRGFLDELKKEHPHVLENVLSAMGRVETRRLLDTRYLQGAEIALESGDSELVPVIAPAR